VIPAAFTTFVPRCVICNRVPLSSLGISRLRISSTGTPTFNLGLSEGAPDNSKVLKSSTEYDIPVNANYRIYRRIFCNISL
ncbi:hypothetical protein AVEN_263005-1, partial [Araneus ventricosus]